MTTKRTTAAAATEDSLIADDDVKFICDVRNVEDLLLVPNTKWVIGSGFNWEPESQNYLHLFNAENETGAAVQPFEIAIRPDTVAYPNCTPPDWKTFGPHGLGLGATVGTHSVLYVVNHGGREAVEVFDVDVSRDGPRFTWTGCVVAPQGFWPDAVAALPDGGIVVTAMMDSSDPDGSMKKLLHGEPVGEIKEWHPGVGFTDIPASVGFLAPNGVIVSPDGKYIFVAMSTGRQVARITRGQHPPKVDVSPTGIMPDNLRWSASGRSILVGGHDISTELFIERIRASMAPSNEGGNVDSPFKILRMDPETMQMTEVLKSGVYGVMGGGTGAIEVGNKLWVSTCKGDRIAIFPMTWKNG